MRKLQRLIESLNHLAAFEASARLSSFTKAAGELGVSQPAVSQSIRRLEAAIGIKLFKRNHRIIALTDAGKILKGDVFQELEQIERSIIQLQKRSNGNHVTLSVSSAFAHYWLVPRLQGFRNKHPQIDLRMQQTDMDLDLAQEGISLALWRGDGNWRGYESNLLAPEFITALASPAWIAQNGRISSLAALKKCRLITLEEPHRYRPEWKDIFAAFGEQYTEDGTGLRLNDYALVLQAGLAGSTLRNVWWMQDCWFRSVTGAGTAGPDFIWSGQKMSRLDKMRSRPEPGSCHTKPSNRASRQGMGANGKLASFTL